jgi:hypothetical protein
MDNPLMKTNHQALLASFQCCFPAGAAGSPRVPLLLPKMLSMSNAAAFALEYNLTPSSSSSSNGGSSSSSSAGSQILLADSAGPVAVHDFGKFVTTFSSKQMPKKLVLHGSDFR